MTKHDFILFFRLADRNQDPREHLDALTQTFTNEAKVCCGVRGYVGFEFYCAAPTLTEAKRKAVRDVLYVIPDATLDLQDD